MNINFLVVDDNPKHTEAAKNYINFLHNCSVTGIVYDGNEAINFLHAEKILPDIILLDIEMKKLNGLITLLYIKTFFPTVKVIILSSHCENDIINDVFAEGADAFVWKHQFYKFNFLKKAIEEVQCNRHYWDERLIEYNDSNLQNSIERRKKEIINFISGYKLTKRQEQVIILNAARIKISEMSSILNLSEHTIKNTLNTLNNKLNTPFGREGIFDAALMFGFIKFPKLTKLRGG